MRQYVRHPSNIPIDYQIEDNHDSGTRLLQNISHGGLCLSAPDYIEPGKIIHIRIDIQKPYFEAAGTVVWCRSGDSGYEIGIRFDDADTEFSVRMVEQICHIEQYRRDAFVNEGRTLSSEQAAEEWISGHAKDFPR